MRYGIVFIFLVLANALFGQILSLNTYLSWFNKTDQTSIKVNLEQNSYRLMDELDSSGIHKMHYSIVKSEIGVESHAYVYFQDSSVIFLSYEMYSQADKNAQLAQLKANKFRSLNANVNGSFITTPYDNGIFLVNQDYEAIDNPLGKGQIPHYRYTIVRKNSEFDALNGTKKKTESINGEQYVVVETYKNGVLDGERITYYPNHNVVKKKENYRAGRLNGTVSDYDELGNMIHSSVHSYHWKYGMEKWYDHEGKVLKSLQWQRDVPVGSERYTFNGKTFTGASYKNGKKEGIATVPMNMKWNGKSDESNVAIPEELNWTSTSAVSNYALAFETVLFVNGQKEGKAIGISAYSPDTLYIAYYKNGLLDSTLTGYQNYQVYFDYKNEPRFRTTFVNGVESGTRIFYITSGPLKGKTSSMENYLNGKLDGEVLKYYKKIPDRVIGSGDPNESLGKGSPYQYVMGDWIPDPILMTYKNGVLHGPFHMQTDSLNYNIGTYNDGQLDGRNEVGVSTEKQHLKISGNYSKGVKIGEWITENILDSTVITKNYVNGKKNGIQTLKKNGKLVEERIYVNDKLESIQHFTPNGDSVRFDLVLETNEMYFVESTSNSHGIYSFHTYAIPTKDFGYSDTTLIQISTAILGKQNTAKYLNGEVRIETPDYAERGIYNNGKLNGIVLITHKEAGVYEQLMYDTDSITSYGYTNVSNSEAYSGKFISAVNRDEISVKNGMRHGWCVEHDGLGNVVRKRKYVKGILKKSILNSKTNSTQG